jgi:hypothetical protein
VTILSAFCCLAAAVQPAGRLVSGDFVVAGITEGVSLEDVKKSMGRPSATILASDQFGEKLQNVGWSYADIDILSADSHTVTGFRLKSSKYATVRGLRVGDRDERVKGLYGLADEVRDSRWRYDGPNNDQRHVMRVSVQGGKVVEIFLGWDI